MIEDVKSRLKSRFPWAWTFARTTNDLRKLIPRVYGFEARTCPICLYHGRFMAEIHLPDIFHYDAVCPQCDSFPRNRLLALAIKEKGLLTPTTRLLHFAPERPITSLVKPLVGLYQTTDIKGVGVDLTLDIEAIDQPDQSWDVIICSHVLEHVDHRRALPELRRILAPNGKLLALFPIVEAWPHDYENAQITSARDRGLHFGKENHQRRFGASMRTHIVDAGFTLDPFAPIGPEVVEYGLIPGETLFIATRYPGIDGP
jgi:SAM-dependent methyltransferase